MSEVVRKELPEKWEWSTLGEVCEKPQYGWTTKASQEGELHLLRTTDITSGQINWDTVPYCVEEPGDKEKYLIKDGDIVVSRAGSVGVSYLIANPEPSVFASYLIRFKPLIDRKYVYYFLKSPAYWNAISEKSAGIALQNVNASKLKEIDIPIAPREQQKRIVAKIEELFSHIDAGIEALKKTKQLLKQYRQSVLKAAVTGELTIEWREANKDKLEPATQLLERILKERRQKWEEQQLEQSKAKGKIPKDDKWKEKYKEPYRIDPAEIDIAEGWTLASWDQVSNWVTYGFTRPMPHVEEGIPIVTGKNVIDSKIRLENTHKTPKENYESLSEKDRPKAGDLLITKDGTIGRAAVVPENLEFCINQSVAVIWLRSCPINRKYLLALIESELIQKPVMAKARGVAIQHLSITDFAKLPVPIPSLEEQKEIIVELDEKLEVLDRLEITTELQQVKAEKNKQSILSAAFSGKLISGSPDDGDARSLLESIKAQATKGITRKTSRLSRKKGVSEKRRDIGEKDLISMIHKTFGTDKFSIEELLLMTKGGDFGALKSELFELLKTQVAGKIRLDMQFDEKNEQYMFRLVPRSST